MKCPHCNGKVGMFDKALNKWGKEKICPLCQKSVRVSLDFGRFILVALPIIIVTVLLNNLVLDGLIPYYLFGGAALAIACSLSLSLRKYE